MSLYSVKGLKETRFGLSLIGLAKVFLGDGIFGRGAAKRGGTAGRANGVPRQRAETPGCVLARGYIESWLPSGVFCVETATSDRLARRDAGKGGKTRRDGKACPRGLTKCLQGSTRVAYLQGSQRSASVLLQCREP